MHRFLAPGEELLDAAGGLPDAVLVLHQGDADVALAVFAEAEARRYRHIGLLDQQLGELHAAELAIGFGNRRPGEHRRGRRGYLPPGAGKAVDQAIPARLVDLATLVDAVLR